jgi:hypothetical protein
VIGFRLVCVGPREARECSVGDVTLAKVAGQNRGAGRASMAFGEQGAADPPIVHERGAIHAFHGNRALHVAELADIVVAVVHRRPTNDCKYKGISGIYLADTLAAKQGQQLLEISLHAEIDISSFEIFAPGARWREWRVPADIINQCGKIRQLPESALEQARHQSIIETRKELVAEGLLEQAKDSHGQLLYRKGKPVWRLTEKGRAIAQQIEE